MKAETALLLSIIVFFLLFVLTVYYLTQGVLETEGFQTIQVNLFLLLK